MNNYGQLGNGTTVGSRIPVAVLGLSNAVAISYGGDHVCALLGTGTAECWGFDFYGELGNGTHGDLYYGQTTPGPVIGLSGAVAISAGYYDTCALLTDRTIRCWGYNGLGGLGDGTTTDAWTPITAGGL